MSSIVTFYSYKGGVGRSMALANIAVLLARRSLRVLAVDWDLEAPGLERYFGYFPRRSTGLGLLRLFLDGENSSPADMDRFTSLFDCDTTYPLTLLTSGRDQDENYTRNLERFDWEEFFTHGGGELIESLRNRWRADYDIVLIDSRTGLSDTGGICTIQMPDIVVAMFTANYQSLYGTRDVMRLAQRARQSLAYDRMPLAIFPLPARWGVNEFQETQSWLENIGEVVQEFYEDWLPRDLDIRSVIQSVKIPQADYFGFGEKLAVVEQGTSDPQGIGFVYEKIADFLASDMKDLTRLLGESVLRQAAQSKTASPSQTPSKSLAPADYLYDVFVSYHHSSTDWALQFAKDLKRAMAEEGSYVPSVFVGVREIRVGSQWDEEITEALQRSKVMVVLLTPEYVESEWSLLELKVFTSRSSSAHTNLLATVILRDTIVPDIALKFRLFDFRQFFGALPYSSASQSSGSRFRSEKSSFSPRSPRSEMFSLAQAVLRMIAEAPPFSPMLL